MSISSNIKQDVFNVLNKYGLRAKKRFGQNFLIDESILDEIVELSDIKKDDIVIEIGPGIGTLTKKLAATGCKKVIAIEIDHSFKKLLLDIKKNHDNLEVIFADILETDIKDIVGEESFKVVANLPYYITTPIVMYFLEGDLNYEKLVVMVQEEVGVHMASDAGSKDYGVLSIGVQYKTKAQVKIKVPSEAFFPAPKVNSVVVVCDKRAKPPIEVTDEKRFFQIVKAAFSQRRKVLSNSLKNMGLMSEQTNRWLELSNIEGKRRAETLSLEEFARLENNYDKW